MISFFRAPSYLVFLCAISVALQPAASVMVEMSDEWFKNGLVEPVLDAPGYVRRRNHCTLCSMSNLCTGDVAFDKAAVIDKWVEKTKKTNENTGQKISGDFGLSYDQDLELMVEVEKNILAKKNANQGFGSLVIEDAGTELYTKTVGPSHTQATAHFEEHIKVLNDAVVAGVDSLLTKYPNLDEGYKDFVWDASTKKFTSKDSKYIFDRKLCVESLLPPDDLMKAGFDPVRKIYDEESDVEDDEISIPGFWYLPTIITKSSVDDIFDSIPNGYMAYGSYNRFTASFDLPKGTATAGEKNIFSFRQAYLPQGCGHAVLLYKCAVSGNPMVIETQSGSMWGKYNSNTGNFQPRPDANAAVYDAYEYFAPKFSKSLGRGRTMLVDYTVRISVLAGGLRLANRVLPYGVSTRSSSEIWARLDRHEHGKFNRADMIFAIRENEVVANFFGFENQVVKQEDGSRDRFEPIFQEMDNDSDRFVEKSEFLVYFENKKSNSNDAKIDCRSYERRNMPIEAVELRADYGRESLVRSNRSMMHLGMLDKLYSHENASQILAEIRESREVKSRAKMQAIEDRPVRFRGSHGTMRCERPSKSSRGRC